MSKTMTVTILTNPVTEIRIGQKSIPCDCNDFNVTDHPAVREIANREGCTYALVGTVIVVVPLCSKPDTGRIDWDRTDEVLAKARAQEEARQAAR